MLRIIVHTNIPSSTSNTGNVWFAMEVDCPSIEELHEILLEDGSIFGHKIYSKVDPRGIRRVTKRDPMILSRQAILTISPSSYEYAEEGE